MNFRNRTLLVTVRTLLGVLLLFSGVGGLLTDASSMQGAPEPVLRATLSLQAMGLFQMIKVTEVVAGLMLFCGFLPALAAIFVAPIAVGVVVFNARLMPTYVPMGIIVGAFDAYLGYAYWDKYKALFQRS